MDASWSQTAQNAAQQGPSCHLHMASTMTQPTVPNRQTAVLQRDR